MYEYRPFLVGLGLGFGLGTLAFFFNPATMVLRLGEGVLALGGLSLLIWLLTLVLDQGLRAFKLYALFIQFMVARARDKEL